MPAAIHGGLYAYADYMYTTECTDNRSYAIEAFRLVKKPGCF